MRYNATGSPYWKRVRVTSCICLTQRRLLRSRPASRKYNWCSGSGSNFGFARFHTAKVKRLLTC